MKLKLSPDVLALNPGLGRIVKVSEHTAAIPRAESDEPTGLAALLVAGWSVQSPDCVRYRLYNQDIGDTGLCDTLKAACDAAKALARLDGRAQ